MFKRHDSRSVASEPGCLGNSVGWADHTGQVTLLIAKAAELEQLQLVLRDREAKLEEVRRRPWAMKAITHRKFVLTFRGEKAFGFKETATAPYFCWSGSIQVVLCGAL